MLWPAAPVLMISLPGHAGGKEQFQAATQGGQQCGPHRAPKSTATCQFQGMGRVDSGLLWKEKQDSWRNLSPELHTVDARGRKFYCYDMKAPAMQLSPYREMAIYLLVSP